MVSDDAHRLLTLCAIRIDGKSLDWSLLARTSLDEGLDDLYRGIVPETSAVARRAEQLLIPGLEDLQDAQRRVDEELQLAEQLGAHLTTVLDDDYPANLRAVPDRPPFLFTRGAVIPEDIRAVAVVGTRQASAGGLGRATRMARELVEQRVTVVSGLARGIDTAAHESALREGGRTIAVIGTGITRCYPAESRHLADRVADSGAVVSQFWPSRTPGRDTFPRRNRVTSGISQGTVVIEASSTSGAKLQARLAHEHRKRVWLIQSLVTDQPWARKMVSEQRAKEVASTSEVIDDLLAADQVLETTPASSEVQLVLDLS